MESRSLPGYLAHGRDNLANRRMPFLSHLPWGTVSCMHRATHRLRISRRTMKQFWEEATIVNQNTTPW